MDDQETSFVKKSKKENTMEHIRFVVTLLEKSKNGAYEFLNHANMTAVYLLLDIIMKMKENAQ
jgi:hypothetical protein